MKENIYDTITQKIISRLEQGVVPWRKPWTGSQSNDSPKNLVSNKPYRGINTFLLGSSGYDSNLWGTFKQVQELGGNVKKGEKGTLGVFWKILEKDSQTENGEAKKDKIPLLKTFWLFNASQCEGLKLETSPLEMQPVNPIESCESLIAKFVLGLPEVRYNETRAYYNPMLDFINLPKMERFPKTEEFYSTYFHEMIHATGHKTRLNRKGINEKTFFGSEVYSQEELVAEMGASFLCGLCQIDNATVDNSAAYIGNWLHALRNDNKLVLTTASQAQKAVDYLTQIKFED